MDDYAYAHDGTRADDWLEMTAVFRNSEVVGGVNKGVEMLNYGTHPVVEDVVGLPGGAALPVLAEGTEYDPALPGAAHRAFGECVRRLPSYPEVSGGPGPLGELIRTFVGFVCADRRLPELYPGHRAADEAYLRSILGG